MPSACLTNTRLDSDTLLSIPRAHAPQSTDRRFLSLPAQNKRVAKLQSEYDRQKKAGTLPPDVDRLLTEDIKTGAA